MKTIQSASFLDYFGLILLSAIWGSAFIAIEVALEDYPPLLVAFGRIVLAAVFLSFWVYMKRLSFPRSIKTWMLLIAIGFLNNAMPFYLISWGQQYINASTASIMLAVGPFVALILSHYVTQDEKFTLLKLIGVILGFLGVFILLGDDILNQRHDSLYGQITMLIAVLGYIGSGLLIRKLSHIPTLICSSSMFITASFILLPFVLFLDFSNVDILSYAIFPIIYLAILPTAIASLIRIKLVQKAGVQFMSQVAYLIPIFAIFWSWIFFSEFPKSTSILALFLVLSGLFIRKLKLKKVKTRKKPKANNSFIQ